MKRAINAVRFMVISFLFGVWSFAAAAKPPITVLVLSWFTHADYQGQLHELSDRLRAYGLHEGADFNYVFRQVRTQEAADRAMAEQSGKPFVIYSTNTSPASFVIHGKSVAPHVFATYSDPLADGWIRGYLAPGGHSTGVVELALAHEKRLDLLMRVAPQAHRIALALDAADEGERVLEAAARVRAVHPGVELIPVRIAQSDSIDAVEAKLRQSRAQAVYVPLAGEMVNMVATVFKAIERCRLPAAAERRSDALRGAVIALELDRSLQLERLASQLALVLRGVDPATIPVQTPRRLMLMVNLDAARALNLVVPREILRQADYVVADGKY